ncbi:MAG: glutathione S-transferase family protein [Pseudomonadota bacterium]
MILYGRDLSPFARRIAIWCVMQDRQVERRAIQTAGPDLERLMALNPVGRVPVLELEDGTQLIETYAICDWLDETSPNGVRLLPANGVARREALQRLAHATGAAEKAVALVYDRNRRPEQFHWPEWQQRLVGQIRGSLGACETWVPDHGWSGPSGPDAGDVAAVIAYQFVELTNPWVLQGAFPRLASLLARAGEIPGFTDTVPEV